MDERRGDGKRERGRISTWDVVGHVLGALNISKAVLDPCEAPRLVTVTECQTDQRY